MNLYIDSNQLDVISTMDELEYNQTICSTCFHMDMHKEPRACPNLQLDYDRILVTTLMYHGILICTHWRPKYEISD